jgi:bifunctional UDP-N-acetylglucosamine pyrophosphorylase/glucosamine-1-phosphate N-acetyltransferase
MRSQLSAIVLAAGEGARMQSARPKPLHVLCGKAMVVYVLDALTECSLDRVVVVVGAGAERVTKKLNEDGPDLLTEFVEQRRPRGTGDAVSVALTSFLSDDLDLDDDDGDVVVLPGDTPLLRPATLAAMVAEHRAQGAAATLLTARLPAVAGHPRVVRGKAGRIVAIADDEHRGHDDEIVECSTGVYAFRRSLLAPSLRRVEPTNRLGEYFLSDVIAVLADTGHPVTTFEVGDATEVLGVNDRVQLARAEAELRRRTNLAWLGRGVTMLDPERTYIDTTVSLAADVTLFPGVILQGRTVVGDGAEIGSGTRLVDCAVGARARVVQTQGRDAEIGPDARVGPYAVLEPGSAVGPGVTTGPFYTSPARDD